MAAAVAGGAILSAFLQVLFDRLASKHVVDFIRGRDDIEKEFKRLKKTWRSIKGFLNDAESKQYGDDEVKEWLDELRDLAYDAEDVIDEVATEALRMMNLEAESSQTISNQASSSTWRQSLDSLVDFSSGIESKIRATIDTFFSSGIESKIRAITERFDELAQERFELRLVETPFGSSSSSSVFRETSSVVDESSIYGRKDDERKIIELLLKEESSTSHNKKFSVIPIVGMGGVGKTTLAQLVYNSNWVQNHYDLKAWVCVSDKFDIKRITKAILESLTSSTCQVNESMDSLQVKVKESLSEKKFLIILDDVWNQNYGDWDLLQKPFGVGAVGSAIIVTTRDRQVARNMGTVKPYYLEQLSEDDCWCVFVQHAFGILSVDARPNLAIIGKEIARKCKGLPLAAKSLGGLLRSKEEFEWENVLNSKIWDLPEEESDILPVLKLSYYYLPSHLKRCFTYCSIFPKDYEFEEEMVVLLWMAEGFLQQPNEKMRLEDFGHKCFRELLSKSFFQPSSSRNWCFVMHDLMSDLALWAAGKTCFRLEDSWDMRIQCMKARHLSCIIAKDNEVQKFEELYGVESLRTFLRLDIWCRIESLTSDLLPKMKFLRVLSLPRSDITELPSSIGDLKHLRYIDISYTKIRSIQESVCTLYNLQTLLLKRCRELTKLPEELQKLINLRHFDISETSIQSIPESVCTLYNLHTLLLNSCSKLTKLPEELRSLINLRHLDISNASLDWMEAMPPHIGRLTSLRKLSDFVVGKDSGCGIEELANLKHLEGILRISKLENVIDAEQAKAANLSDKKGLNVLEMEWCCQFDNPRNERVENEVLDKLRPPHEKLKKLSIICYGGVSFPAWVGEATFSSMVFLKLEGCEKCTHLPPLGQLPLLKDLYIERMKGVVTVGPEFYGKGRSNPFPSLETLSFVDMKEWKDWVPCAVEMRKNLFPLLRKFSLEKCPNLLGSLPDHLPSLEIFEIKECKALQSVSEAISGQNCNNSSLELLNIEYCDSLTSIARASLLFSRVKKLNIKFCPSLQSLMEEDVEGSSSSSSLCSEMMMMPDSSNSRASILEGLYIVGCRSLTSLFSSSSSSRGELPPTLKKLAIVFCPKLESLGERFHSNPSLDNIIIFDCESLKFLPENLHSLTRLSDFKIYKCPSLVRFPDGGLPAANLRDLTIIICEKLEALPSRMHDLTSLQFLRIKYCPNIVSSSFPQEEDDGFPTSITTLEIGGPNICKALFQWGLHRLSSLRELIVRDGCLPDQVSFPAEAEGEISMVLPSSLIRLSIYDFPNLESLSSKGFQNLTSLEHLSIFYCPKLQYFQCGFHRLSSLTNLSVEDGCPDQVSFPAEAEAEAEGEISMVLPSSLIQLSIRNFPNLESLSSKGFQNLTSLEELRIWNCPKLQSFPENGLPPSLLQLEIDECTLLKQRCERDQGQEWFKISHIPQIRIDGNLI